MAPAYSQHFLLKVKFHVVFNTVYGYNVYIFYNEE